RGELLRVIDVRVAVGAPPHPVLIGKWGHPLSEAHGRTRRDRFDPERLRHLECILDFVISGRHALVEAENPEINTSVIELLLDGLEGVWRSAEPPFPQSFLLLALSFLLFRGQLGA